MDEDGEIVLIDAAKRFGAYTALHPTNLVISRGQAVLLVGANGAGKSTLLRLVAGLSRPSDGEVQINGHDLQDAPEARSAIGLLSHQTLLYDELTARENLRFFARLYGLHNVQERLDEALAEARLGDRQHHRVRSFSRGMKQRLALARATLHRPSILLLDEPFSMVEPLFKELIHEFLSSLKAKKGILLTDHYYHDVWQLADRNLVLKEGNLLEVNTLNDLVEAGYLRSKA